MAAMLVGGPLSAQSLTLCSWKLWGKIIVQPRHLEFFHMADKPHMMMDFNQKANIMPCYLLFLLILRHQQAGRVPWRHTSSLTSRGWCNRLSVVSNSPHTWCIFVLCFIVFRPNLFSITEKIVMISGMTFDWPDSLYVWERNFYHFLLWLLQNLHDHPDCLNRTQLYPNNQDLSHPGRLQSSG